MERGPLLADHDDMSYSPTLVTRATAQSRRLAELTPDHRNRYVDLLRAVSILVVVFGHWLMAAPEMIDGDLRVGHLIADHTWVQWLTWVLQVMPIFFFVGGYANLVGWRAARRNQQPYGQWLSDRLRRLTYPLIPLLGLWVPAAFFAWKAGVDPGLITIGSQAALVPVWFLATYVLIVMAAPLTIALWERWGLGGFAVFVGLAAMVDVASLGFGVPFVQWLNYIFVWNAVHMLGYAWADGRLGTAGARTRLAAVGLTVLAGLVAFGPYPLAMVGLDGAVVTNSNPPKVTLIALGLFQFGAAMALEVPARRWLANLRTWTAVVAVNASIMSLYLWHLTVMVLLLGTSIHFGGIGLGIEAGTVGWWATRPMWLAVLIALTLPVMGLVSRFERPRRVASTARAWRPALGVLGLCAGLGLLARFGIADTDGLNVTALTLTMIGLVVGGVIRTQPDSDQPGAV